MKLKLFASLGLSIALLGVLTITSCSKETTSERERAVTSLPEPQDALSEELILALAQARNFHHKADVYLQDANLAAAIAAVENILALQFPANAPEGEDVLADARARLAKLLVTAGNVERAMSVVEEGLSAATRESFFVANLHTVRGEVFEAKAALVEESDAAAAKAFRVEAIKAYDQSISINDALQQRLFEQSQGERP